MSNRVWSSQARGMARWVLMAAATLWLLSGVPGFSQSSQNTPSSPDSRETTLRVLESSGPTSQQPSTEIWIHSETSPGPVTKPEASKPEASPRIRLAPAAPVAPAAPARTNVPAQVAPATPEKGTPAPTTMIVVPAKASAPLDKRAPAVEKASGGPQVSRIALPTPAPVVIAARESQPFTGEFVPADKADAAEKPAAAPPAVAPKSLAPSSAASAFAWPQRGLAVGEGYADLQARVSRTPVATAAAVVNRPAAAPVAPATPVVVNPPVNPSVATPPSSLTLAIPTPSAVPTAVAAPAAVTIPTTAPTAVKAVANVEAPNAARPAGRITPVTANEIFAAGTAPGQRSLVDLAADLQTIRPDEVPYLAKVPAEANVPTLAPPRDSKGILAQRPALPPAPGLPQPEPPLTPTPMVESGHQVGPFEVIDSSEEMKVIARRSKLLRTKVDIFRTAVVDPSVCDIVQFTPREISIIGKREGATDVTFWFNDESHRPMTCLVRVTPDPDLQQRREEQYGILEDYLAELFPNSKVTLTPVADKLLVRGQARDAAEAAQILAIIRGQAVLGGPYVGSGAAAPPIPQDNSNPQIPATQVINLLRIPGVQQVSLRVKIAELNRSSARNFGVDLNLSFNDGKVILRSMVDAFLGSSPTVLGSFDNGDLEFGIHYLEKHGVIRMLSEPTLMTLSGRPATFIAGGEFAVPTTVGVSGVAAVTTDFRAYGAIITFLPTILDKDNIRLEVSPEFSQINSDLEVNGTPGLNTRAVTTTVELRAGQTLAIAGLLDDSMKGDHASDLPIVSQIFGKREMTRNETELIILVTPELVHPMEPEEVPPLPGFDVTEPTNCEFFVKGHLEGKPTQDYRSTVWPTLRHRYQNGGPAMISGPFGHGN